MRVLIIAALCVVVGMLACSVLLPERYAVNAPFLGTFFGAEAPDPSELERRMTLPDGFQIEVLHVEALHPVCGKGSINHRVCPTFQFD